MCDDVGQLVIGRACRHLNSKAGRGNYKHQRLYPWQRSGAVGKALAALAKG